MEYNQYAKVLQTSVVEVILDLVCFLSIQSDTVLIRECQQMEVGTLMNASTGA